ncbi:MAG: glucose-6-phosphate isomerase [Cardiobacteriaceae bacterium]|nr:glucose-6-phosphate isomerase [Cardiobacteriaceae bacterium]
MTNIEEKLRKNAEEIKKTTLNELFQQEGAERVSRWSFEVAGIYADLSKNFLNLETKRIWHEWAAGSGIKEHISATVRGEEVNLSEHRPALHTALRDDNKDEFIVNEHDIHAEIRSARLRMKNIAEKIHSGDWTGANGEKFTDIVHIGIGGSELGPRLIAEASAVDADKNIRVHFLATTDPNKTALLCKTLNPATTIIIIASKTFSTEETIANAIVMRDWLRKNLGDKADKQLIALTAHTEEAANFGIDAGRVLPFWDWVGGRYSLWSAIALPFILQNGFDFYEKLLHGAAKMDQHYQNAPFDDNLPLQLALLDCWYNHYFDFNNRAVIPYADGLGALPQYLQQLEMESLGKKTKKDGSPLDKKTGGIVWGGVGTNAQHAFFQLIHQGQRNIPLDFLTVKSAQQGLENSAKILNANCLAQAEALMRGKKITEFDPKIPEKERAQRVCDGNRPSTMFILQDLSAETLGALLAMFEHKTAALAHFYGINAYDQWGVELGKILAKSVKEDLTSGKVSDTHDQSTATLIKYLLA